MRLKALPATVLVLLTCSGGLAAAAVSSAAAPARAVSSVTAGPGVSVTPKTGPPTATVTVSGTGFDAHEAVDIYFDTVDKALASTDDSGSFLA